jgi:succinate-semialdehyde dehydrogenase/glutarate-semialdehyde dehydrogenase
MAAIFDKEKNRYAIYNPVTKETIDYVPAFSEVDIDQTVDRARLGFKKWSGFTQYQRNEILKKFVSTYMGMTDELGLLLSRETGKPLAQAKGEFNSLTALTSGYCEKARHLYGISFPSGAEETKGVKDIVFTRREPIGTVVSLLPFNYPIDLFGQKVMPALVAGNSVIVKPPSDCPLTISRVVRILHECGVPEEAVHVVTGSGSVIGDYLVSHKDIQIVSMTGSTETGIRIYQKAAANLTRVYLELGGNDSFIVLKDADIRLAVKEAMGSRVSNAGQICCASKRFIVHQDAAKAFTDILVEELKKVKQGDPLEPGIEMGSLVNESAARQVEEQVELTVRQGAKCILGGRKFNDVFFPPTVLTGVTAEMDVAKDMEIFAPVFPIIEFNDVEEAIQIANQSSYGLMGAVFSADYKQAFQIASRLEAGGVVINGGGCYRLAEQPFGGYKKSGIGREGISRTLDEYTQEKTYAMKGVL